MGGKPRQPLGHGGKSLGTRLKGGGGGSGWGTKRMNIGEVGGQEGGPRISGAGRNPVSKFTSEREGRG